MNESQQRGGLNFEGGCLWPGVGAALAIFIVIGFVLIAAVNRLARAGEQQPIELTVVPYKTSTETPRQVNTNGTATLSPELTPEIGEAVIFSVGELVEIFGTEGDGLRLRNAPGLSATINVLALENEVFEVRGGPEEVDGYIWWFLINPYDNAIQGWGVGNFLRRLGS